MTTSKPIVLVIGIGPTLKIINTIKTIAHLILAQLETVFIVIQQFKSKRSEYATEAQL